MDTHTYTYTRMQIEQQQKQPSGLWILVSEFRKPWCYSIVVKILIQFHDLQSLPHPIKHINFVLCTPAPEPLAFPVFMVAS